MATIDSETMVRWADGTEATLGEVQAGEYDWMSDDYEVVPFPGHTLYKSADFSNEEYERGGIAKMVIDGGLGICKSCGAGEAELDEFATCRDYNQHRKAEREREQAKSRGQFWVQLQDILDSFDPERPYILLEHAADRLALTVTDPSRLCILTPSAHLRDVLATPARNPGRIKVMTAQMAVQQGLPDGDIVLLGHSRIGNSRNKIHRLIRHHQAARRGRAICIDRAIPGGISRYMVAAALGRARAVFGGYHDFMDRNFIVAQYGCVPVPGDFRAGKEAATAVEFMGLVNDRFAGMPNAWATGPEEEDDDENPACSDCKTPIGRDGCKCEPESVDENRPEIEPHEHGHCPECDTPYCMGNCQPGDRKAKAEMYPK
ncbi:hypothetical protein ACM25O_13300 [Sulfitobacter pontiacus]